MARRGDARSPSEARVKVRGSKKEENGLELAEAPLLKPAVCRAAVLSSLSQAPLRPRQPPLCPLGRVTPHYKHSETRFNRHGARNALWQRPRVRRPALAQGGATLQLYCGSCPVWACQAAYWNFVTLKQDFTVERKADPTAFCLRVLL